MDQVEQPATQSQSQQPVAQENEYKPLFSKQFFLMVIIGVVILVIGTGSVIYFFNTKTNTMQQTPTLVQKPTATPSPSQIQDETANWKTYHNDFISFTYPPNYSIKNNGPVGNAEISDDTLSNDNNELVIGSVVMNGFLSALADPKQNPPNTTTTDLTIDNHQAVRFDHLQGGQGAPSFTELFIKNTDTVTTEVYFWNINKPESQKIIKKIIDSIRITQSTTLLPIDDKITNWKMYTGHSAYYDANQHKSAAFTIKYPEGWEINDLYLYPFGKPQPGESFDAKPVIVLGAGGYGDEDPTTIEHVTYPAGVAKYFWYNGSNASGGFYSFNNEYIFEAKNIPQKANNRIREVLDKMMSTFKLMN